MFPMDLAAADLDGCGHLDLVSADAVSVLKKLGGGSFAAAKSYAAGFPTQSLVIGDFDEDGRLDIVATSADMQELQLLRGV
jgi:hypothetical protein